MRLLNFSVGRVQTQTMFGEAVPTAMVKAPVPRPWMIGPDGPVGNEKALHVDHLFVYARTQYSYWAAVFGVDPARWPDGFFGENLTLDEMDEATLRLGDVYAVGPEVKIVVAGPRTPCWKVAWRLEQPMSILKQMALSGHTGTYFSVLEPGEVHPGAELTLVHREPDAPTVSDIAQMCSAEAVPPAERVRQTLAHPGLSGIVRVVLEARLAMAERAEQHSPERWKGWREFTVTRTVERTAEITSFTLTPTDRGPLPRTRAGQFVSVRLPSADQMPVIRSWTLSRADTAPANSLEITVKHVASGSGSTALRRAARAGATLGVRAPTGRFLLDEGTFKPTVLIAAGIGITPMRAMIHAHLARGQAAPPLWLLYGARNTEHQAFRTEFDELFTTHDHLHVRHFFSQPSCADHPGVDYHHRGRITAQAVIATLADNYLGSRENPLKVPWYEAKFYVCGPQDFCHTLRDDLISAGAADDHVVVEAFSGTPSGADSPTEQAITHATINFRKSRVVTDWIAAEGNSLLDLAGDHGITIASDCRSGICNSCRTRVIRGSLTHEQRHDTHTSATLCTAQPCTPEIVLDA